MVAYFAELNVYGTLGLIGFALYLCGFGALQFEALDGNGRAYAWINILAAMFVLVSLYDAFNLASALIQISWIIFGYIGLVRRRLKASA